LWAADDPFVGEWKLNPSKSKLSDEMKVESAGGNKCAFDLAKPSWPIGPTSPVTSALP